MLLFYSPQKRETPPSNPPVDPLPTYLPTYTIRRKNERVSIIIIIIRPPRTVCTRTIAGRPQFHWAWPWPWAPSTPSHHSSNFIHSSIIICAVPQRKKSSSLHEPKPKQKKKRGQISWRWLIRIHIKPPMSVIHTEWVHPPVSSSIQRCRNTKQYNTIQNKTKQIFIHPYTTYIHTYIHTDR